MTKNRGLIAKRGTRAAWVAEQQGRHFCGCGCGGVIPLRVEHYSEGIPRYLHGHNSKSAHPRAKPKPPRQPCACGCGELAGPGKRYVSGHNSRGHQVSEETRAKISEAQRGERSHLFGKPAWNAKPPPPAQPCACGCGKNAKPGRRYLSGHNVRGETGPSARAYLNGRYQRIDGYVFVLAEDHPYAVRGYVQEHRLVLERYLRATDPSSPYLIKVGERLYLRPDVIVHHRNDVKDDNRVANLQPLTNGEHTALHHAQRRAHYHEPA